MALSQRQKLTIVSLVFYWPALFILAHIPIPQMVRKADVSDKGLHFLAYLILVFLLWSAISPHSKVNWRKAAVWWVLLVTVWYGVIDEVLQSYVAGRSTDIMDFVANLGGTLTGLIVLSLFTFWPAFLVVTGITIFGLTNISQANLADLLPVTNTAFHFSAYSVFTLLWIQCMQDLLLLNPPQRRWLIVASSLPIGFVLAVKLGSFVLGRSFAITDVIVSTIGVAAVVSLLLLIALLRQRLTKAQKLPPTDD